VIIDRQYWRYCWRWPLTDPVDPDDPDPLWDGHYCYYCYCGNWLLIISGWPSWCYCYWWQTDPAGPVLVWPRQPRPSQPSPGPGPVTVWTDGLTQLLVLANDIVGEDGRTLLLVVLANYWYWLLLVTQLLTVVIDDPVNYWWWLLLTDPGSYCGPNDHWLLCVIGSYWYCDPVVDSYWTLLILLLLLLWYCEWPRPNWTQW